ncbi:unnamed protein product, partial [Pylaiella littoralis]
GLAVTAELLRTAIAWTSGASAHGGLTGFGLTRHFFIAMTARRIRLWGGAAVVVPVEARSSSSLASFGSI